MVAPDPELPFATVSDLESRWRSLSKDEHTRAEALLDDASGLIVDTCPRWEQASPATLRRVTCSVVRRAMAADDEDIGATSLMDVTGPFTTQRAYSSPAGDLFLTKAEKAALGGVTGAFETSLLGLT
ncbi:Hypothetical protein PFR_JS17-2_2045 [Propionibacterium freudenreichii]|nr:Hypothetical protein PFR_JS17-1_2046 [Propionibacterium freudenreichii]SCQ81275.1 Hypothetical protein PFR_JS17-2_2045 [Propionibacterium freudenreichii]